MASSQEFHLAALFVESVFYGFNLITIYHCFRALLFESEGEGLRRKGKINKKIVAFAVLLSLLGSVAIAWGLATNIFVLRKIQADMEFLVAKRRNCQLILENGLGLLPWYHFDIVTEFTLGAQILLGDFALIFRCWVIYNKKWLVILPSLLMWFAMVVCVILGFFVVVSLRPANGVTSDANETPPWAIFAIGALTLALNILTTSLTVWKIWSVDRLKSAVVTSSSQERPARKSRLGRIIRIIIDSAALYTISVLGFVVTSPVSAYASSMFSMLIPQIMCISFNLIIIRAANARAERDARNQTTLPWNAASNAHRRQNSTYHISMPHASDAWRGAGDDVEEHNSSATEVVNTQDYSSRSVNGSSHSNLDKNREETLEVDSNT